MNLGLYGERPANNCMSRGMHNDSQFSKHGQRQSRKQVTPAAAAAQWLSIIRTTVHTRSVNKVMRLFEYNSVFIFKLKIEFVPFKIVPLGGYTPPEMFPLFVAALQVANQ